MPLCAALAFCLGFGPASPDAASAQPGSGSGSDSESGPLSEAEAAAANKAPAAADLFFVTEVAMGSSIGISIMNPQRPSAAFREAGFAGLVPTQWTPFALNGELWVNRHVPAFDYIQFEQARRNRAKGGATTSLKNSLAELSYGYAVFMRKGFAIVPRAGLGFMEAEQRVQASAETDLTAALGLFPDAGGSAIAVQKTAAVLDLGASFTYLVEFKKGPPKVGLASGLRFGLRFGGLVQLFDFGPQGRAWKANKEPASQVPDMRLDGFYLRLFVAPSLVHRSRRE